MCSVTARDHFHAIFTKLEIHVYKLQANICPLDALVINGTIHFFKGLSFWTFLLEGSVKIT